MFQSTQSEIPFLYYIVLQYLNPNLVHTFDLTGSEKQAITMRNGDLSWLPEVVIKCQDPELDCVFRLVLTLVRLNQQVVFLLQQLHTFVLNDHL